MYEWLTIFIQSMGRTERLQRMLRAAARLAGGISKFAHVFLSSYAS